MAADIDRTPEGTAGNRTTLKDVAIAAGVHHTTVSRALRDDPQISVATCTRVKELARRMEYQSDPMLQALSRYRGRKRESSFHGTLAWLRNLPPDCEKKPLNQNHFDAALERAAEKGYRLECFELQAPEMTPARIRQILTTRGIRGILLPPQRMPGTKIEMDFSGFSTVMIGNTLESPKLHRVGPSQFENSRTLASRLLADPALRVGFYLPVHLDERSSGGFSAGF